MKVIRWYVVVYVNFIGLLKIISLLVIFQHLLTSSCSYQDNSTRQLYLRTNSIKQYKSKFLIMRILFSHSWKKFPKRLNVYHITLYHIFCSQKVKLCTKTWTFGVICSLYPRWMGGKVFVFVHFEYLHIVAPVHVRMLKTQHMSIWFW